MAVKSCRGRVIDWQTSSSRSSSRREGAGAGVVVARKVVCLVSSSSPSSLLTRTTTAITAAAAAVRSLKRRRSGEEQELVDCAKRTTAATAAFHVGTRSAGEVGGGVGVGFNGEGGQNEGKLDGEQMMGGGGQGDVKVAAAVEEGNQSGMGFYAKTTYLGKVFCFVSLTLLLLFASCGCCCYLRSSRSSSYSTAAGDARTVNREESVPQWSVGQCHKSGGGEEEKVEAAVAMGDRSVQSATAVVDDERVGGPVARMTLLVIPLVLVSSSSSSIIIWVILLGRYHKNKLIVKDKGEEHEQQNVAKQELEKTQQKLKLWLGLMMIMIKGRMNRCMQICQDLIIKMVAEGCGVGGRVVGRRGLRPNLQVDRFYSRQTLLLLANAHWGRK